MPHKLIITLEDNGQVNVNGPIENKLLCFGMIEIAKNAIKDFKPSPIIKPNGEIKDLKNNGS